MFAVVGDTFFVSLHSLGRRRRTLPTSSRIKSGKGGSENLSSRSLTIFRLHISLESAGRLVFTLFSTYSLFLFILLYDALEMSFFARMITSILAALTLASISSIVVAAPAPADGDVSTLSARDIAPSTRFVIYSDNWVTGALPSASTLKVSAVVTLAPLARLTHTLHKGYNVVALSFLTRHGAVDQASNWASLSASAKNAKKNEYHKAGIKIIASAFGATDTPTTSGADAVGTANTMAKWVKSNGLDGIDVDYEDLTAMNKGDGKAEKWLTSFTQTLRKTLPKGQYILTHAPLAPWLAPNNQFKAGAYVKVNKDVGSLIDWVGPLLPVPYVSLG